jgi:hypothetical protein
VGIFKVDQKVLGLVIGDAGLSGHGSLRGHLKGTTVATVDVAGRESLLG